MKPWRSATVDTTEPLLSTELASELQSSLSKSELLIVIGLLLTRLQIKEEHLKICRGGGTSPFLHTPLPVYMNGKLQPNNRYLTSENVKNKFQFLPIRAFCLFCLLEPNFAAVGFPCTLPETCSIWSFFYGDMIVSAAQDVLLLQKRTQRIIKSLGNREHCRPILKQLV